MSMFVSLGAIAGPAIGGFILQFASWSYIFWINVPLGVVAYLIGRKALPEDLGSGSVKDADLLGATQMFLTIVAFFIAVSLGQAQGFVTLSVILSFAAMIALFAWFIHTEKTVEKPLLNLNIFSSKLFSMSVLTSMTMFTAGSFVNIIMPFYLQDYRGAAAGFAGMVMMAYPVGMFIFSPIAGVLSDKFDKEIITFFAISGVLIVQLGYLMPFTDREPLSTVFYEQETANIVREKTEKEAVNQSILQLAYSHPVKYGDSDYLTMQVLNGLLGGFSHSKLFTNVREKESLAYYANSRFDTFTGFLKISAGIDAGQRSKALTIIRAQVRALAQGDISDSELDQTKNMLRNAYFLSLDSPSNLIEQAYIKQLLPDRQLSQAEWLQRLDAVTKADVVRIAKILNLQALYFMEGESLGD